MQERAGSQFETLFSLCCLNPLCLHLHFYPAPAGCCSRVHRLSPAGLGGQTDARHERGTEPATLDKRPVVLVVLVLVVVVVSIVVARVCIVVFHVSIVVVVVVVVVVVADANRPLERRLEARQSARSGGKRQSGTGGRG
jgi:hypothetical protein